MFAPTQRKEFLVFRRLCETDSAPSPHPPRVLESHVPSHHGLDFSSRSCTAPGRRERGDPRAAQLAAARRAWGWAGSARSPPSPSPRSPHPLPFLGRAVLRARPLQALTSEEELAAAAVGGSHARSPPRPEPAPGCPPLHGRAAGVSGNARQGAAVRPAMSPLFSWVAKVGGIGAASGGRRLPPRTALGADVPAGEVVETFVTVGSLGVRSGGSARGRGVRLSFGGPRQGRPAIPGSRRESGQAAWIVYLVVLIH